MLLDTTCSFISKFFTEEEVQQIHSEAVNLPLDVGKVGMKETDPDGEETKGQLVNDTIRKSDIKWFTQEKPMSPNLVEKIHQGVGDIVTANGWEEWEYEYLEDLQYTIYHHRPNSSVGDFYTWHTDAGFKQYGDRQRKLSFSLQLSDPDDYEGGAFEYIDAHKTFDRLIPNQKTLQLDDIVKSLPFSAKEKGSIIVFPSHVHHQVKPVTHGTRISLVGWMVGKNWK